jgi:hypothetical protein
MKLAGAAWLIALLAWLPIEDITVLPAYLFALFGLVWLAWRRLPSLPGSAVRAAAAGAAAGLAVPAAALLLMAFKSGLHGHGFAEYTAAQVWSVVQTIPVSTLVGLLIGLLASRYTRTL